MRSSENLILKRIGVSGAFFDIQKLDWINQQYLIKNIPENQLWERIKGWAFNDEFMQKLMPLCHSRIKTFGEFMELCDFFFVNHLHFTAQDLCPAGQTNDRIAMMVQAIMWDLDARENWKKEGIEKASHHVAEVFGVNFKKVIIPVLYVAITGKRNGPPLFDAIDLLGKERTRARFMHAIDCLGGISNKKMDLLTKSWDKKDCKELGLPV